MKLASVVIGVLIAGGTFLSALRTVVLPRAAQSWITRGVFRAVRLPFMISAGPSKSYELRDRRLALYAPLGLVMLPLVWLVLALLGFSLVFWGIGDWSYWGAFAISGSSLTTLGFAAVSEPIHQAVAFVEAGIGLMLVALMISFLPTIYAAFSRREGRVGLLEVRAGSPPSAVEFLDRHNRIGALDRLDDTFVEWEAWFANVEESHLTYPALVFFRSPQPERSWVVAAGTILDVASLATACVKDQQAGPPSLCIRAGYLALRRIADFFGIEFDPDPAPDDPISISRLEFDAAWNRMAAAGLPLKSDQDEAWLAFAGWRVNYDTVLLHLAEVTVAPAAPWTSDRSAVSHREPRLRRFGRRHPS